MKIYIVWTKDYENLNSQYTHIVNIYKNKEEALNQCDNKEIFEDKYNELICEYNIYFHDYKKCCSSIEIPDDSKKLFFLKINEYGGGQSYDDWNWIYIFTNMDSLIERALLYFSEEHNRDNEYENCGKNNCGKNNCEKIFIRELKKNYNADVDCTDYEGASMYVWDIDFS